jgi:hypothetical protein
MQEGRKYKNKIAHPCFFSPNLRVLDMCNLFKGTLMMVESANTLPASKKRVNYLSEVR